ncbi:MAG: hypothetical protein J07HQX50_01997 [Haloquadratum sp. J07HQX50]|nr:MAG: hypothetical protein J07HQX50_01997 [Haloquadratum sp. J07HQX50]
MSRSELYRRTWPFRVVSAPIIELVLRASNKKLIEQHVDSLPSQNFNKASYLQQQSWV